jgi:hypothetical protein
MGLITEKSKRSIKRQKYFLTASEPYYENFRKEKFTSLDKELFIIKPISNNLFLKKIELS